MFKHAVFLVLCSLYIYMPNYLEYTIGPTPIVCCFLSLKVKGLLIQPEWGWTSWVH